MIVEPLASLVRALTAQLAGSLASVATRRVGELTLGTAERRALRRVIRESAVRAVAGFGEVAAISAEIDLLADPTVAEELLRATVPGSRPRWTRARARWSRLYGQPPDRHVQEFLATLAGEMRPRLQRSRVLQGLWVAVAVERQAERLEQLERLEPLGRRPVPRRRGARTRR
jgi:hypothetical protein